MRRLVAQHNARTLGAAQRCALGAPQFRAYRTATNAATAYASATNFRTTDCTPAYTAPPNTKPTHAAANYTYHNCYYAACHSATYDALSDASTCHSGTTDRAPAHNVANTRSDAETCANTPAYT